MSYAVGTFYFFVLDNPSFDNGDAASRILFPFCCFLNPTCRLHGGVMSKAASVQPRGYQHILYLFGVAQGGTLNRADDRDHETEEPETRISGGHISQKRGRNSDINYQPTCPACGRTSGRNFPFAALASLGERMK